ncbi:MAG: protein translocase subunit SecD, partial [Xanthobacteraceae bacterium]
MLHISRLRATVILLITLFICLSAAPNFLPETTFEKLPRWTQRHIVLGLDLQGGSHILLEVDSPAVRKEMLQDLLDSARQVLREARIGYTGLAVRSSNVEVRLRNPADVEQVLPKLEQLSQSIGGIAR